LKSGGRGREGIERKKLVRFIENDPFP